MPVATKKTKAERLELLKQQKANLEKELKEKTQKLGDRIKAIELKDTNKSRKDETRRKVLLGAMILRFVEKGEITDDWVGERMDKFLTGDSERKLFGLEIIKDLKASEDSESTADESNLETPAKDKNTPDKFNVVLRQVVDASVAQKLVDVLSQIINIGLEESQQLAELANSRSMFILKSVDHNTAVAAQQKLESIGCRVDFKQVSVPQQDNS